MATITEDYVSFEIAKLLREKGFNGESFASIKVFRGNRYEVNGEWITPKEDTIIPTIQMAMKWLREKHNLIIQIEFIDFLEHGEVWLYSIIERKTIKRLTDRDEDFTEHSYEQACEAALKYCLEFLI